MKKNTKLKRNVKGENEKWKNKKLKKQHKRMKNENKWEIWEKNNGMKSEKWKNKKL